MFLSCEFQYNGISSYEMGVSLVSVDSGMIEVPFGYRREIIEEKISHKDNPYFYGFEKEPLPLKITIAKLDEYNDPVKWTFDERDKIVEWLYQDNYCPLISADNPEVIYYCTPVDEASRFDNGCLEGYVTLTLRCNSPYAYTPTYIEEYKYLENQSDVIEINNLSNIKTYYFPEIQANTNNSNSFKLINLTDGGREFTFNGLSSNEIIYVNNELHRIKSNKTDQFSNEIYRLSNCNKNWFRLVKGVNRIRIVGNVDVLFRCTYPIAI